ncbi:hypothetical protein SDC9_207466 [bioreactor metagenome]|uniref:Uncharacterized protein n=1 Tax=bioreactor metagenome TaxID=1076179 RepID=A0A645JHB4_9ZZZZ
MHGTWLYFTAKLFGHGLQAVANTQYRYAQVEYNFRRTWTTFFMNTFRTTRQDDTVWFKCANVFFRHVIGIHFRIYTSFTYTTCNKLTVLRTEIQNQDAVFSDLSIGSHDKQLCKANEISAAFYHFSAH